MQTPVHPLFHGFGVLRVPATRLQFTPAASFWAQSVLIRALSTIPDRAPPLLSTGTTTATETPSGGDRSAGWRAYNVLADRLDRAKASTQRAANQSFVEDVVPEFFDALIRAGLVVDEVLLYELLTVYVAYLEVEVGWSFRTTLSTAAGPKTVECEIVATYDDVLRGERLASSPRFVDPITGATIWKISIEDAPVVTALVLRGTTSDGRARDVKLTPWVGSGAFSDSDQEIGRGFIEDARFTTWALEHLGTRGHKVVTGHSLGAAGAQLFIDRLLFPRGCDDVSGFFYSPPSPSTPWSRAWERHRRRMFFIANASDAIRLGGRYGFPGLQSVLAATRTPVARGTQPSFADALFLHHGTPNWLFAMLGGWPRSFVDRPGTQVDPSPLFDDDPDARVGEALSLLINESSWSLADRFRRSVLRFASSRRAVFTPVPPELVIAAVESVPETYAIFYGRARTGPRGVRLAAFVELVVDLVWTREVLPASGVREYVAVLAPLFDRIVAGPDSQQAIDEAAWKLAFERILAIAGPRAVEGTLEPAAAGIAIALREASIRAGVVYAKGGRLERLLQSL
ncbi:hypothetical protein L6R52_05335 [Myxococcota bacterium]|nr:hypothetical protein [Myxococcota bacterium]